MSALTDLWNTIHGILLGPDHITLGIIIIVSIGVAFMTEGLAMIVTSTFVALVAFGVAQIIRGAVTGGSKMDISGLVQADWHALMGWQVQMLLAYAIIFAVLIAIFSTIRGLVFR
jgi:hypothetical protein